MDLSKSARRLLIWMLGKEVNRKLSNQIKKHRLKMGEFTVAKQQKNKGEGRGDQEGA
jgi:hypothetical protein